MSEVLINEKHDIVFDEAGIGVTFSVLKFNYRLYIKELVLHVDKYDSAVGGNVINVSLMYGPMRILHLIQKYLG